ncbi:MAG: hypothetical protein EOP32_03390 [Rhodococcus sp. (in: high G+C Gram-positive bacteria)]|nr:MAG: hypothetical protein EOP32_03390 [Rhodococcus sp. (in: high G+C Gram-positive bacteria)]
MAKIVLLGSDEPFPAGTPGTSWDAASGEPAYRKVIRLGEGEAEPDRSSMGPGVSVWIGEQIDSEPEQGDPGAATALLAVGHQVAPDGDAEVFDEWWNTDHIPSLSRVPGTLSAHRYCSASDEPMYFAIYHLKDADVRASDDWKTAATSELGDRARQQWGKRLIGVYTASPAER